MTLWVGGVGKLVGWFPRLIKKPVPTGRVVSQYPRLYSQSASRALYPAPRPQAGHRVPERPPAQREVGRETEAPLRKGSGASGLS